MAESEETGLECQVFQGESDDDSSFEVIEDPKNPQVSTLLCEVTINSICKCFGFFPPAFAYRI